MKIFVATHNAHKLREISQILPGFEIVADNPEGVEETAPDFAGNALIKVRAIAPAHRGSWCMADDSGLEVAALGGAPGVRSARYAGEPSNTPANNALLLKNLDGAKDRTANFTCAIALVDPEGREHVVEGKCFGAIARSPSGAEGFGYDPLFIPDGYAKSFAELSSGEKNAISHRGRALAKVKEIVGNWKPGTGNAEDGVRKCRTHPWLRLFRVVNLPTVPGDILVGASAIAAFSRAVPVEFFNAVACASMVSVLMYMFGLVQNDILGAKTDRGRPIPDGLVSIAAAKKACCACWILIPILYMAATSCQKCSFDGIRLVFFAYHILMTCLITFYNAKKSPWAMGLCRAFNVLLGGAAAAFAGRSAVAPGAGALSVLFGAAAVWFVYIWAVTRYSKGEETDPAKKRRVGALVGGIVYLQLAALIAIALLFPQSGALRPLLLAGAAMLVLLRLFKSLFPRVSAS